MASSDASSPRSATAAGRLLVGLLVAPLARAENPEPYRLSLALDGALLGSGLALFAGGRVARSRVGGPDCFPCDPDGLNRLDRPALGYRSDGARIASDATRDVVLYGAAGVDLADLLITRGRLAPSEGAADMIVLSEVFLFDDGVGNLVKAAVRRPRPDAYRPDQNPGAGDDPREAQSFYSGHTTTAFSLGTAATITFWRRHPRAKARWVVAGVYLALASATGVLRIAAGQHFPTDVIAGAAAGTVIGAAVPLLHSHGAWVGPATIAWRF